MNDVSRSTSRQPFLRRCLAEPLVHFLLLGCLLFALDAWWMTRSTTAAGGALVIGESRIKALAENFRRTWQRLPTRPELDGLVEEFVRDEILTREAERLGLGNDDTVIRRRLRQKLEIITEEASAAEAAPDAALQAFLDAHAEAFRGQARVAFDQVFFDPARRGERVTADVTKALAQLNDERRPASADFAALGDRLFVLQPSYPLSEQRAIAASFGEAFAVELAKQGAQNKGRWLGPVESGYGLHLVRIREFEPGATPTLDQVRALVEREWRNARRVEARDSHYRALRENYRVTINWPKAPS